MAGLVAITPAAGFVAPGPSVIIGLVGGVVCYGAVSVAKHRFGYDDALDAFGVHGIGGTWGAIATGIFASKAVNPAGADGLLYGNPELLPTQLLATVAAWVFGAVMSFAILKVLGLFMKLRVDEQAESAGLDLSEHGERGYAYQDLVAGFPVSHTSVLSREGQTYEKVLTIEVEK
ncbi:Ammonium transporter [bioreactor metagenome]|uniref:Ammonium transporter n=1 Tax=bioreactor metagenome TaxID=1076179 RepID=A0A645D6X8_9ZZZZ